VSPESMEVESRESRVESGKGPESRVESRE
jgi:hypothetical protein